MSEENKGFDFTGLSADEDFDSFLESIRRDLDGTPAPRPAAPTAVEDRPEPAEERPVPRRAARAEKAQEPEPKAAAPRAAGTGASAEEQPPAKRERRPAKERRETDEARPVPAQREARPKPVRRQAPEIKWNPPPEEEEPPVRRGGFARALILYALVLLVVIAAGLAVLWKYLEAYEFTRPENVMEQFEQMANEQYWETAVTSSFVVSPSEFETESALVDELCLSLLRDGQMSYVEDEGYTDEAPIYLVSVNGIELCRVYMSPQAGGEAGFGLEYMSIDKVELLAEFIAPASRSISITAPADATVTLNGITVGESYISSEAPDASVLPELEPEAAELLCRYDIQGIYGTVEIAATSASGEQLEAVSSDRDGAVFPLPEGEVSVTVYAPEGAVLSINGVELDESYKTGDSVTLALFEGLESYGEAPAMEAWEIGGLHLTPEISAVDASGAELSAPYLQDGAYVFQPAPDAELESSQRDYAEKFYELYSAFAANKDEKIDTNYYNILPYMYGGTPLGTRLASEYSSRLPSGGVAAGSYDEVEVTGFVAYGDNLYTCTVLLYNDDELAGSCEVAFIKASGKWYAAATVEYSLE